MVPSQSACRSTAADVRQSGVPGVAPAKNPSPVAAPEVLRVPAPLDQLPWEFAKDEFGSQQADFMGVLGALLVRTAKDEFRAYLIDPTRVPGTLPGLSRKTRS